MKIFFYLTLVASLLLVQCTPKNKIEDHVVSVLDAPISHLDPIHSTNKYSSIVNSAIFEGLYHYHYLKRPIEPQPRLATEMPKISPDKKVYTIKIKPEIFFQDDPAFTEGKGRELEAKDFIYSWKRLADPKNKALGWWVFDGLIEDLNNWRDQMRTGQANYSTEVSGLKALDKYTLQITLTRPSFQFIHYLAMPVTMVVAREVVEKYGPEISSHPVGTGPFILENWTRNSQVVLVKNKKFRDQRYPSTMTPGVGEPDLLKNAHKKLPLSDKVVVRILPERQPLWLSFLKGELDHGIIPKDNYAQVMENGELKASLKEKQVRILHQARPDMVYISINMENPILGKNKEIRQAMAYALDRKSILKNFYNDRGLVAQSPIPPGLDAYNDAYKNPIQYDLEKAKELMKQAGYPEGKGLPVFEYDLANASTWGRQMGEYLKDQWGKIGIKIKLIANTWPQFDKKIKEKKATLFDMAWMADYPDSQNFLQLFYSKNISPGPNSSNFISRRYDDIYEKAVLLPPGPERTQLFHQLVDLINEEVPAIFTIHRTFYLPYHGWLEGYFEHPIIYDFLQYLSVDKNKKEKLKPKF